MPRFMVSVAGAAIVARMTRAAFWKQTSVSVGYAAAIVLAMVGCGGKSDNSQSAPASTTAAATKTTGTTATTTSKAGANLSGEWESNDYECPAGVKHTERLRIAQDGTHISAVKTLGDDCVPTGHESFSGNVTGKVGSVRLWTATPGGQPTLGSADLELTIQDANTFTLTCPATLFSGCKYKVTRVTTPN